MSHSPAAVKVASGSTVMTEQSVRGRIKSEFDIELYHPQVPMSFHRMGNQSCREPKKRQSSMFTQEDCSVLVSKKYSDLRISDPNGDMLCLEVIDRENRECSIKHYSESFDHEMRDFQQSITKNDLLSPRSRHSKQSTIYRTVTKLLKQRLEQKMS